MMLYFAFGSNLNQKQMASFQAAFSVARQNIKNDPGKVWCVVSTAFLLWASTFQLA